MYSKEIKLNQDEVPAKVNIETGEITVINARPSNIPIGKSKLDYDEFSIVNTKVIKILSNILSNEELGVILYMITIADFNSNSLNPLCDDLSLRDKAEILNIKKDRVKKITDKLFKLGVYLSIKVYEGQEQEYWVLNPNISWKGRLVNDSLFQHFKGTTITQLLRD